MPKEDNDKASEGLFPTRPSPDNGPGDISKIAELQARIAKLEGENKQLKLELDEKKYGLEEERRLRNEELQERIDNLIEQIDAGEMYVSTEVERLKKIVNYVGGSPSPIPWDELQQKYIDEIEWLRKSMTSLQYLKVRGKTYCVGCARHVRNGTINHKVNCAIQRLKRLVGHNEEQDSLP